jgi:hypothetical protein
MGKRAAMPCRIKPPSLYALINHFDGVYSAITPEAWARYDRGMKAWLAQLRYGEDYIAQVDEIRERREAKLKSKAVNV